MRMWKTVLVGCLAACSGGQDTISADAGSDAQVGCEAPRIASSGTFGQQAPLFAGGNPYDVAAGDINGDCALDLAIVNANDNTVSVFRGNGDGTFAAQVAYPVPDFPVAVALVDLTGDSRADLAVSGNDQTLAILLNTGDGTFAPRVNYPGSAGEIVTGDLDADGDIDLATSAGIALTNDGHGTLTASAALAPIGGSIALCDFDGANGPDMALATYDSATTSYVVNVLLNTGAGFAAPVTYLSGGSAPNDLVCGDLDGNGSADLAIASGIGKLSTLANTGNGTFAAPVETMDPMGFEHSTADIGDVNGDGALDLVANNRFLYSGGSFPSPSSTVSLYLNNGSRTFATTSLISVGTQPAGVLLRDFDNDGRLDLAVANQAAAPSLLRGAP